MTELDVGDDAWILFWREFPLPGQPKNGTWDKVLGTVVSVAKSGKVCAEVYNQGVALGDAASPNSNLRFVPPDRVFRTSDECAEAARTRPAPV